jgi:23S rRNA (adenine2503-C2)-methyltransferase
MYKNMQRRDIIGLTIKELEVSLADWQEERYHARQIFSWIYKKGARDFESMSDLPFDLRRRLKENFYFFGLKLSRVLKSSDGTEKILFELRDGNFIEAVAIPTEKRTTGCLSTQAGCRFSCRFCASGLLGFKRNLTTAEMIEEVLYLKNNAASGRLTHIVFMGIGEPLDNYDNVLGTIRIINSPEGLHIGARRITISTCGLVPGIKRLAQEGLQVELSVSLHAADDKIRSQIMPINRKYPLSSLLESCRSYIKMTNRQVTFEYVLIKGMNSDLQNARKLSIILRPLNCKVNLIPANAVGERGIEPPDKSEILLFKDCLVKSGINVTLRRPRGEDIAAACGQLRLRYEKK